jgi:hypothetical protein
MSPQKRRGAPLGNQNARKYGLYSRLSPWLESENLASTDPTAVQEQIDSLRLYLRRLAQISQTTQNPRLVLATARAVIAVVNSIQRMVRFQRLLAYDPTAQSGLLVQAIEDLRLQLEKDHPEVN